jgi:hypothetical protein
MTAPDVLTILGRSVADPATERFLTFFRLRAPNKSPADAGHYELSRGSEPKGISVELAARDRYDREFAEPAVGGSPGRGNWIVKGVDLLGEGSNTPKTRRYQHALPFGLSLGDTGDRIIATLGKRPRERGRGTSYAHAWWFVKDGFRFLTALDDRQRLIWLRFQRIDRETAAAMERKRAVPMTLDPQCAAALEALTRKRPTLAWAKPGRKDARFTSAALTRSDALLAAFVTDLVAAARTGKPASVLAAVKKVTTAFNRLNPKAAYFIETQEREELCAYIDTLVRKTGYRIAKGEDLTRAWRDEW